MVLSSRISVRLSHDACPGFSARFQSFKRICPRKFKQISQQSSNRFVCTSGGLKGDMLEDPLEKPSTTFEAIKQGHFNPNPRLRQEPGTPYSVQCRGQSNSQKTSFFSRQNVEICSDLRNLLSKFYQRECRIFISWFHYDHGCIRMSWLIQLQALSKY